MSIEAMKLALDFISRLKFADAEPEPDKVMEALRTAIEQAEKQDCVAMDDYMALMEKYVALKAQRQGVGLTDEEFDNFTRALWPREATAKDFIRAIEAKLKEKNNGNG